MYLNNEFLTMKGIATSLHASERTIRRWVQLERLPRPVRIGKSPLWKRSEVEQWIAAGGMKPPIDPPNAIAPAAGGAA